MSIPISGGYCSGVPPLPIPNREVKPACADGTAMQCGRVGGRRLYQEPCYHSDSRASFFLVGLGLLGVLGPLGVLSILRILGLLGPMRLLGVLGILVQ